GLQCARVKGLSPVMDTQLWMPTWLCSRKAISREPNRPWLQRIHWGRRPWHVTKAASGTREILWALPGTGVGWHNRHTGRKPDTPKEVGCLHMSDDVGERPRSKGRYRREPARGQRRPHAEVEPRRPLAELDESLRMPALAF